MIFAADNLHPLNPDVAAALEGLDPGPIRHRARRLLDAGAQWIDINPGYLPRSREDRMTFLVETVQETVSLPLILDSPHPRLLRKGLQACRKTPILNGLTLEPRRLEEILPLAVEYETPLVVLLLDDRSFSPPSVEEKAALAAELHARALAAGVSHQRLLFDPLLPNMSWADAPARIAHTIETVRLLSQGDLLGRPAGTLVGLSNLRSGLRRSLGPELDCALLGALAQVGLHAVLADVLNTRLVRSWKFLETLAGPSPAVDQVLAADG
ncbi:5-methyltetrahydrofolate corrinoid/iron sulfur protein methyltransferase [Desulfacinum hydrothermale DSM 13146]|uniref:5-methyltetrahydrofolate corrinoid/iron sulfur protein methyltransferase n=1 Tax=Desulfacinum hydrothermale DSM 13146 TaxID=1121390 RepID=A0A1W1XP80_9BACT|nr:dihydropteroate synthase [Desulfacinum hydrothermale]SMC25662.1 5-methyltetrahydrofolate corrinoid/iron sulfur protein methyltransferase [Desulfacinum hydrothermale DSM 13146]